MISRARWPGVVAALVVLGAPAGCQREVPVKRTDLDALELETPKAALPGSAEAFLDALIPQPAPLIYVTYALEGAGGMTGNLEVWTAPGGYRKEAWTVTLRAAVEGEEATSRQASGVTIQTPREVLQRQGTQAPVRYSLPLEALARAWMDLEEPRRRAAYGHVVAWHADRARAASEAEDARQTVAGQVCTARRIAGQTLCISEQSGLLLSYESGAFRIVANRVELRTSGDPALFAARGEVMNPGTGGGGTGGGAGDDAGGDESGSTRADSRSPVPELPDAAALLEALERGDMESLAPLVHPGFRVSLPDALAR